MFYEEVATKIIEMQEQIIGPLAREIATDSGAITFSEGHLVLQEEPVKALEDLVQHYALLFGNSSVEVCKEATQTVKVGLGTQAKDMVIPPILS